MAPFLEADNEHVNLDGQFADLVGRGLGSVMNASAPRMNNFTEEQVAINQALTLGGAGISIIAGLLAFYWFIRMRATFRHHLIMLLLGGDLLKSISFFIVPIATFTSGPVKSDSALCHASGFLLAFTIESADYTVFVMAFHAALTIFIQHADLSENGLYPHRHLVFIGWVAIPALMASLAFINPTPYVSSGTFCYLPVRPFWYRLALSWIPRYAILITIASIYIAIYFFVRHKFRAFNFSSNDSSYKRATEDIPSVKRESRVFQVNAADRSRATTLNTTETPFMSQRTATDRPPLPNTHPKSTAPSWGNYTFGSSTPMAHVAESDAPIGIGYATDRTDRNFSEALPPHLTGGSHQGKTAAGNTYNVIYLAQEKESSDVPTKLDHLQPQTTVKESHPTSHFTDSTPSTVHGNDLKLTDSKDLPMESSGQRARHKAIKRQLRFLFIYPVVYLFMWLVPFVQHCLNYDDNYAKNPSFPLACIVGFLLSLQGLVDSVLFCLRETPWRTSRGGKRAKSTWRSCLPWAGPDKRAPSAASVSGPTQSASAMKGPLRHLPFLDCRNVTGSGATGGQTKGQSVAEARAARARREAEKMVAREDADKQSYRRKMSLARRGGSDRSWWEVEGQKRNDSVLFGAPMSPDTSLSPKASEQSLEEPIMEKFEEEKFEEEKFEEEKFEEEPQPEETDEYYHDHDEEAEIMEAHSEEFITPTDWPLPSRAVPSLSIISPVPPVPPLPPLPALLKYSMQPVRDSEESLGPMDERWSTEMRRIPGRISGEEARPLKRRS